MTKSATTEQIGRWQRHPAVRAACESFADGSQIVETAIAVQQIPAPTFDEARRAAFVAARMRAAGLDDVEIDTIGNVYGRCSGHGGGPGLLIAAHIDTVFPADTDLTIRYEGSRIYGPSLGDNSLGVAALLHLGQALRRFDVPNEGDIWLVANVGEEGLGDLRGMRAAVDRLEGRIGAALALEGCDQGRILHEAIGVRRYRITATAPGGHSWSDFGSPSAVHGLVCLAARLTELQVSSDPKSTFNIGVIDGGSSINTIAERASLLLDLRAAAPEALDRLVRQLERIVAETRAEHPGVAFSSETVGDRPAGSIPRAHPLVRLAVAAYQATGTPISFEAGSTDANIPLSRGIPALCVAVGDGDNAHRLDEYIEPSRIPAGMRALLWLALAATSAP